jgi:hypothetical protein
MVSNKYVNEKTRFWFWHSNLAEKWKSLSIKCFLLLCYLPLFIFWLYLTLWRLPKHSMLHSLVFFLLAFKYQFVAECFWNFSIWLDDWNKVSKLQGCHQDSSTISQTWWQSYGIICSAEIWSLLVITLLCYKLEPL